MPIYVHEPIVALLVQGLKQAGILSRNVGVLVRLVSSKRRCKLAFVWWNKTIPERAFSQLINVHWAIESTDDLI